LMALFGPGVFWGCRNPEPYAPAGLVNLYEGPVTTYQKVCGSNTSMPYLDLIRLMFIRFDPQNRPC